MLHWTASGEGDILPVSNFMEVLRCCCCFLIKRDYLYSPLAVLDFVRCDTAWMDLMTRRKPLPALLKLPFP